MPQCLASELVVPRLPWHYQEVAAMAWRVPAAQGMHHLFETKNSGPLEWKLAIQNSNNKLMMEVPCKFSYSNGKRWQNESFSKHFFLLEQSSDTIFSGSNALDSSQVTSNTCYMIARTWLIHPRKVTWNPKKLTQNWLRFIWISLLKPGWHSACRWF